MQSSAFKPLKPKAVLGVAAHPDDLDFSASGTFSKWASQGTKVYYLILTDGSKGSIDRKLSPKDLIIIRQKEQKTAAEILGAKQVFFSKWEDCCLECRDDVKLEITRTIRKIKPDVVVTIDPAMVYAADRGFINHPDHRAAGQATLDAVFPLARDHLSFPELLKEGLEPHATPTVLLVNLERQNWFEDITDNIDKKMEALAAHQSQMPALKRTQKMMRDLAIDMGKKGGCDYAEGFMRVDIR